MYTLTKLFDGKLYQIDTPVGPFISNYKGGLLLTGDITPEELTKNFKIKRYTIKIQDIASEHYFFVPEDLNPDIKNVFRKDIISEETLDIKLKIIVGDVQGPLPIIEFTKEDIAEGKICIKHMKLNQLSIIGAGCEHISSDGRCVWIRPRCKDIVIGSDTVSVYIGPDSHNITIGPNCSVILLLKTGTLTWIGANVHRVAIDSPNAGIIFVDENQGEEGREGGSLTIKEGKDYIVRDSFHKGEVGVKGGLNDVCVIEGVEEGEFE